MSHTSTHKSSSSSPTTSPYMKSLTDRMAKVTAQMKALGMTVPVASRQARSKPKMLSNVGLSQRNSIFYRRLKEFLRKNEKAKKFFVFNEADFKSEMESGKVSTWR